jgi:hypothetical protein
MIISMRFFVMILVALCLPLGSGSGAAMAAESHHNTTQAHQPGTHASAAHESDCLGHSTTVDKASPAVNDVKAAAHADCDACSACQSCHPVGLAFSRTDLQPLQTPNAQPQALSPAFASAPAARDQKPPIS